LSDDFLFPMSTSSNVASHRLSYTSSPESDGELCETPKAGRARTAGAASSAAHIGNSATLDSAGGLPRSTSDPNLVDEVDNSNSKVDGCGNGIPDYHVPPPYAVTPKQSAALSPGSDSKYGFSSSDRSRRSHHYGRDRQQSNADSVDDLPLPPHPQQQQSDRYARPPPPPSSGSSSPSKRSLSQPPSGVSPPKSMTTPTPSAPPPAQSPQQPTSLPPKIDRHKKPSRRSTSSQNGQEGVYSSSKSSSGSLDRNSHIRDMKMAAFTNGATSVYDPYNSTSGPYSVDAGANRQNGSRNAPPQVRKRNAIDDGPR